MDTKNGALAGIGTQFYQQKYVWNASRGQINFSVRYAEEKSF